MLLWEGNALPKQGEGKKEDDVALRQWSPTFLPSGVGFVEDNFAIDQGRGMVSEWFKLITSIVQFISIIITSAPPQIIRH